MTAAAAAARDKTYRPQTYLSAGSHEHHRNRAKTPTHNIYLQAGPTWMDQSVAPGPKVQGSRPRTDPVSGPGRQTNVSLVTIAVKCL